MHKAGADPVPVLESNSMIVLISHVRTGRWASVLPEVMADSLLMGGGGGGAGDPLDPDHG